MPDAIRWGIIGTGTIARKFAEDLRLLPDAQLMAIGSRSKDGAETFGRAFNIPHRHGSYAALAGDTEVDCVYIATPHSAHRENTLLCLDAGKPVLCEKPFAINAAEATEMIRLARRKKLLLMEAMWTRCFPSIRTVRDLVAQQVLGELELLTADFGFRATFDAKSRLFSPKLGGGALLDLGIYPVSLASMVFNEVAHTAHGKSQRAVPFSFTAPAVSGMATIGRSKVDEQAAMTLKYPDGQLAVLHTSIRANTSGEAAIYGAKGSITIHSPFWKANKVTVRVEGRKVETMEFPYQGHGYHFEAVEFMNCLRAGKTESSVMPLDETLSIMRTLDTLRTQFGVRYPID